MWNNIRNFFTGFWGWILGIVTILGVGFWMGSSWTPKETITERVTITVTNRVESPSVLAVSNLALNTRLYNASREITNLTESVGVWSNQFEFVSNELQSLRKERDEGLKSLRSEISEREKEIERLKTNLAKDDNQPDIVAKDVLQAERVEISTTTVTVVDESAPSVRGGFTPSAARNGSKGVPIVGWSDWRDLKVPFFANRQGLPSPFRADLDPPYFVAQSGWRKIEGFVFRLPSGRSSPPLDVWALPR